MGAAGTGFDRAAPGVDCGPSIAEIRLRPVVKGDGPVAALCAGSSVPDDLAGSGTLALRAVFREGVTGHQIYVDTDTDRMTGMWSFQSAASAAGWDLLSEGGRFLRHDGRPNEWVWQPAGVPGASSVGNGSVTWRLSTAALGSPDRIRFAVAGDGTWLPGPFFPGAEYPPRDVPRLRPREPQRLAIFYSSHPWDVRDCGGSGIDIPSTGGSCPADVFGKFAHVAFAGGLEEPDHPSFTRSTTLMQELRQAVPGTELWGYVSFIGAPDTDGDGSRDGVHDVNDIRRKASSWKAKGATGVFLDEFGLCRPAWQDCPKGPDGSEIALTRERQTAFVQAVHDLGLAVFANGFEIMDVLGPIHRTPTPLGREGDPRDAYLIENPTFAAGSRRTGIEAAVSEAKYGLAARHGPRTGVRITAVDTASGWVDDSADRTPAYRAAWTSAATAGAGAYGYTNPSFSARSQVSTNLAILDPPPGGVPASPDGPSASSSTRLPPSSQEAAAPDFPGRCTTAVCGARLAR